MSTKPNKSVVFVCLGNICRSVIAEAVFRHLVKDSSEWKIDSAATAGYHTGSKPDSRTLAVLKKHNLSTNHRARTLSPSDFYEFGYIIGCDFNNIRDIKDIAPSDGKSKVCLLGDFTDKSEKPEIVVDPYYGGTKGFDDNYEQCIRLCEKLRQHIESGAPTTKSD